MNAGLKRNKAWRRPIVAKALTAVSVGLPLMFSGVFSAYCSTLQISRDGRELVLTWEGDGRLQSADNITGPWQDELGAINPHRLSPSTARSFYRVFYPFGLSSLLEPPEIAFAEPNAAPSQLAHELVHTVQQGTAMEMHSRINLFSGEVLWTEVDLQTKGRGMDFTWARKYRSRTGPNTAQGYRWDFSYNILIQRAGPHVKVFDGNGRADILFAQPDGTYAANQFFREGRFDSNDVFAITFADKGIWEFRPLTAASAPGKISRIIDRNGNALAFSYDTFGRLSRVTDTLERDISIDYNADGFIESVTDFIGRQVRYAYYQDPDANGSFGDLKSVTSAVVTNTPNGNNFPAGKTTTYAYTEGFADDRANHMLTTVASGAPPSTKYDHVYQHNQTDLEFLRVTARRIGYEAEVENYKYFQQTPSISNGMAVVKAIVNDRVGNVSEHSYDAGNRLVLFREFTGRAVPGQPTTETLNRPMNPLRTNDPPFFETHFEWNEDSLLTRAIYANGNSVSNTYELAINAAGPRRSRGNLRTIESLPGPLGGDQSNRVARFEYEPAFNFATRHIDGRSNDTFYAYDERGNCTNIVHPIAGIVEDFEYNQFGQLTAYVAPDNGSGQRSRFNGQYYTSGVQHSYLHQVIADAVAGGLNLTTTYEYDAVGNLTRMIDPRGNDSLFTYNALDQLVRAQSPLSGSPAIRYARDYFYDANDNLVRTDIENRDENGTLVSSNTHFSVTAAYDVLNCRTQVSEEISSGKMLTTQFRYDANRNLTLIRFPEAVNSNQPENAISFAYDERDLLFQETRAPGSPDASTTFVDYDRNANCKRVAKVEALVLKQKIFDYDGFNRLGAETDPMGNVARWHYDANGNVADFRLEGELEDVADGTSNTILFAEKYSHDSMNRLTSTDTSHFDPATQTAFGDGHSISSFTYAGISQLLTSTDDNNHTTRYNYDRVNRLASVVDPKTNVITYTYDAVGNRIAVTTFERSDLGNPPQVFTTGFTYDALNRLTRVMDNVSNVVQYAYDSRNNPVLTTDPLGVQTRRQFEGVTTQSRQITVIQDMNGDGASATDKNDIIIRQVWDDSSRLVQGLDDNDHAATYSYDGLNRLIRTALADGTAVSNRFDTFDNVVMTRDANSNVISYAYDLLNRVTNKTIVPGPGVSSNTTFERFAYDGVSRLVYAQNNGSTVEFAYDSLGNLVSQVAAGKTNTGKFDGVGNMLSCVYPSGRSLQFNYDGNDNQTQIQEGGVTAFTRKVIGVRRLERRDYGNRTRTEFLYDGITGVPNPAGDFGVKQLIRATHSLVGPGTIIDDRSFRWNQRYSKTSRNDLRSTGPMNMHQFTYDAADRLTRALVTQPSTGGLRDTRYGLDGAGNRTAVTNNGVGQLYTRSATTPVPADSQVNQYTTVAGDALRYDENGNLTRINPGSRDERQLEFDYANRLVRVVDIANERTNQFVYDALDRRVRKTVSEVGMPTQVERYSYWFGGSAGWQLVEEQNILGTALATYVHDGFGGLVQMRRGANDYFYHCDDQGNVMALTDELGNVAERYEYDDFGAPQFFNASGNPISESAVGNPYLFNGLRFDSETGYYSADAAGSGDKRPPMLLFEMQHWPTFDPVLGRSISRNQPDGFGNALTFAGNNPWSMSWEHQYEFRSGKWAQTDYEFESPSSDDAQSDARYRVKVKFPWLDSRGGAAVGTWKKVGGLAVEHEVIEYQSYDGPGVYRSTDSSRTGPTWSGMTGKYLTLRPRPYESSDGNVIYVSTAGGGAWKTRDGGASYINPKAFQIISAGNDPQAVITPYFNPKEITIDKRVPWQKSQQRYQYEGGMFFGLGTYHSAGHGFSRFNYALTIDSIGTPSGYNHPDLYQNIWINQGEIPAVPSNQLWQWKINPARVNGTIYQ